MIYDAIQYGQIYPKIKGRSDRPLAIAKEIQALPNKFKSSVIRILRCLLSRSQSKSGLSYCELSVGFIAKGAEVAFETARRAWHWIKPRIGFMSIHIELARRIGFKIRHRKPGLKWGQHLVLHDVAEQNLNSVSKILSLSPVGPGRDWHEVVPVKVGSHWMCKCPFHDDNKPSMILNRNPDGHSGASVCFVCQRNGARLTGFWVRKGGKILMSKSSENATLKLDNRDQYNIKTNNQGIRLITQNQSAQPCDLADFGAPVLCLHTANKPKRTSRPSTVQTLVYRVSQNGAKRRTVKKSLVEVLRSLEHKSNTEKAWSEACYQLYQGDSVDDKFATVDHMVPSQYREVMSAKGKRHIPSKWKPICSSYILVDLDGFESAPSFVLEEEVKKSIQAVTKEVSEVKSGAIVIRTSHLGIQVLYELSNPISAKNNWMKTPWGQLLSERLDRATLREFRKLGFKKGHADRAVHAVGRNMRLPGYRLDKQGLLYRSRILLDSI